MTRKKFLVVCLISLLLCVISITPQARAADAALLTYHAGTGLENPAVVNSQSVGGETYLFLPSSADLEALALSFSGENAVLSANSRKISIESEKPFNLLQLFPSAPANDVYAVTFTQDGTTSQINIMRSENLRSLYITVSNEEAGRSWIDLDKGNKAKNDPIVLLRADGSCVYEGTLKEIKGRGNSTWYYPKKPYQIKLNDSVDLLETGNEAEAEKTWVLLANYADNALIRNSLTNDLAAELGIAYSHNCEFVDFYYGGEYRGTYLLSEKTETGDGRVDIRDLEGEIEDLNGDTDFDDLPSATGTNKYGGTFQYISGVALPEDYSNGYLLEIDYAERAQVEKSWFVTNRGQHVVCKSPEYLPADAMDYISSFYQEFEDAVYNGGINPTTGKSYTDYIDLDSLAKCYLIMALSQNGDAFLSSTFFYMPEGEQKLYAGPIWDNDSAYGLYVRDEPGVFQAARNKFVFNLLQIDSFHQAVRDCWNGSLKSLTADVLLNTSLTASSGQLRSIASYAAECASSQKMDDKLWSAYRGSSGSYESKVLYLKDFITASSRWVSETLTDPELSWTSGTFQDIAKNMWYTDAVDFVVQHGLFSSGSNIMFHPNGNMTRAMTVTVLYRMAGSPQVNSSSSFTDVENGLWYSDAVAWAQEIGIVNGYDDGRFGVDDSVTREQLSVFLYRYANAHGSDVSFKDIPESFSDRSSVSVWAEAGLSWAVDKGIITGIGGDTPTIAPLNTASRAEAAVIFYRYCLLCGQ